MVCWCSPLTIIPVKTIEVRFLHPESRGNIILKEFVPEARPSEERVGTPLQLWELIGDQRTSMARPRSQVEA